MSDAVGCLPWGEANIANLKQLTKDREQVAEGGGDQQKRDGKGLQDIVGTALNRYHQHQDGWEELEDGKMSEIVRLLPPGGASKGQGDANKS